MLELELDVIEAPRCRLRFRFYRPQDAAESSLGLAAPVPVTIDEAALLAAAGSPQEYGQALSAMLFADPAARKAFAQARAAADRAPLRVRLSIDPGAPQLHNLRWETLYDLDRGVSLCADENLQFSRALSSLSTQSFEPPQRERLTALVVIASPRAGALAPLEVPAELLRAQAGLAGMDLTVLDSGGKATFDNLLNCLQDAPDILYLVAHGAQGEDPLLFLEQPDGSVDPRPAADLLERLRGMARLPLLAVLVSCESGGDPSLASPLLALGPRLLSEAGIPAVIGMHGKVSFPTMEKFLPVFFRELQRDGQIDRALAVARSRVLDAPDWWMPVLFSRLRENRLLEPPALAKPLELLRFEPETVFIPEGPFWMGRDPAPGTAPYESPRHEVCLPAYRIGKYPVTNRQYHEYIRQTGAAVNAESGWEGQAPPADRLDCPVTGVTWYQAVAYCDWLSQVTGRKYRLPSEAQWEKAARGPQGWLYPWGDDWQEGRCNTDPNTFTPIDRFPAQSAYGCFDMAGNAREWTLSLWGSQRSQPDPQYAYPWVDDERNDPGANPQVRRVYRGGVADSPAEMTCTARNGIAPDRSGLPGKRHGFRVVFIG